MSRVRPNSDRPARKAIRKRALRPVPEALEDRLLLYSQLGDKFVYSSRITYSFMPDGTSVGGVPSALYSTLNAKFATASWQQQIEQGAAIWENAANLNLALVSDGGEAVGSAGNQQDDSRFGDIRIGAVPLASGTLAVTFLPPPANGGTDAGDILLNSNINWQINSNYDLMTVVAHEFGHALGLGDVSDPNYSSDVMYGTYSGIKQALAPDDSAGIQAVDRTRQFDVYNTGGKRNITYMTATNITPNIGANSQIAIPSLDMTTPGDSEWFQVTVPSSTTGTMKVTVQSSNLSSFSPKLMVYTSSLGLVGQAAAVNSMGATVSVSTTVAAGQTYYVKVLSAGGYGPIGGYGLLVNMGSQSQSPIPPPNTVVAQQPDKGGGSLGVGGSVTGPGDPDISTGGGPTLGVYTTIGALHGWALVFTGPTAAPISPVDQPVIPPISAPIEGPIAPIITPPAIRLSPLTANTVSTTKHHVKSKHHPIAPRFAVAHRAVHVKDHAKPKHHAKG
jgi:Matrixin